MMLPLRNTLLTLLLLLSFGSMAENSVMTGLITATGMGTVDTAKYPNKMQARALAKRAAKVDAQRNLLEVIEGVQITSGTTVKDAQLESDLIANRVKGMVEGAFVLDESVISEDDGILAEVTLAVCMNGRPAQCRGKQNLSRALLETIQSTPAAPAYKPPVAVDAQPVPAMAPVVTPPVSATAPVVAALPVAETVETESVEATANPFTGLIIDASAHEFSPYFDVRVKSAGGKEVYGPSMFQASDSNTEFVRWAKSVEAASAMNEQVGDTPLVVTAASISQDDNIVLTDDDAVAVFKANLTNSELLQQGRVVIVVR